MRRAWTLPVKRTHVVKNISDESERANGDCYIGRDIKQVKKERDC